MSGEAVCVDHGGTRVSAYAYGAENVIWVIGTNKIVDTLEAALARVRDHVFPLEAARVRAEWNVESEMAKTLIISGEHKPGRIRIILVDESLGY
jgi:LUD domain